MILFNAELLHCNTRINVPLTVFVVGYCSLFDYCKQLFLFYFFFVLLWRHRYSIMCHEHERSEHFEYMLYHSLILSSRCSIMKLFQPSGVMRGYLNHRCLFSIQPKTATLLMTHAWRVHWCDAEIAYSLLSYHHQQLDQIIYIFTLTPCGLLRNATSRNEVECDWRWWWGCCIQTGASAENR